LAWIFKSRGVPCLLPPGGYDERFQQHASHYTGPELNSTALPVGGALQADPWRHRFTLVFDREGYSPDFLPRMKDQRIAGLT
jgi:hypothetical protein